MFLPLPSLFLSFPSSSLQSHPPLLCHSLILSTLLSLRVNGGLKDVPIIFLAVGGKHYTLCEHSTNPAHYCRALCPPYPPWDRDLSTSIPTPSCERVVLLCHLFFFRLSHMVFVPTCTWAARSRTRPMTIAYSFWATGGVFSRHPISKIVQSIGWKPGLHDELNILDQEIVIDRGCTVQNQI